MRVLWDSVTASPGHLLPWDGTMSIMVIHRIMIEKTKNRRKHKYRGKYKYKIKHSLTKIGRDNVSYGNTLDKDESYGENLDK